MRKSQQQTSRKRSSTLNRLAALNRKRRRWWKAMIIRPLTGPNTRTNRQDRLQDLMVDRDWSMPTFRSAPQRPLRWKRHGKMTERPRISGTDRGLAPILSRPMKVVMPPKDPTGHMRVAIDEMATSGAMAVLAAMAVTGRER